MGKSSVTDAASKSTNGSTAAAEAKVGPETITLPNGIQVKPDYGSMHFQSLFLPMYTECENRWPSDSECSSVIVNQDS